MPVDSIIIKIRTCSFVSKQCGLGEGGKGVREMQCEVRVRVTVNEFRDAREHMKALKGSVEARKESW
jgi:hypothetical protein